jgi:ribosome-associated toxin RatA of RatAB toxin-antitoxin module
MSHPLGSGSLGAMPLNRRMLTVDERLVHVPVEDIFALASDVEGWPRHLPHYRYVRFRDRDGDGGLVEMAANRPFWIAAWPTWWLSLMAVDRDRPAIRFRHVGGITTGMDVEWQFTRLDGSTLVRIVHAWNGPRWPLIGGLAATSVIGPVFIHGIASRTLAGLAGAAETHTRS